MIGDISLAVWNVETIKIERDGTCVNIYFTHPTNGTDCIRCYRSYKTQAIAVELPSDKEAEHTVAAIINRNANAEALEDF